MHELKAGLNIDKFCYFLNAFETFLSLIRFVNDDYTLLKASRLAPLRKKKTCESDKRNTELFL